MINSPSPTPAFVRINDQDLTEIELHSVESINDLHRTNTEHFNKGSTQIQPAGHSNNGVVQEAGHQAVYTTSYSKRPWWYSVPFNFCTTTACRYSCACLAVTLVLVILSLIFSFLVQQSSALRALSQGMSDRQESVLEISRLLQELQELRRNLTTSRGWQAL
ncbi:hypothetical protein GN956_G5207 [Arapaima gigas]